MGANQVGNRVKRTDAERKEDALRALKSRILGKTLVQTAAEINADRHYDITPATVSTDISSINLSSYQSMIASDDDRTRASVWYEALAEWAIVEGISTKDTQMLRVAMDARWKVHMISIETNEEFNTLLKGSDPEKITPEWIARLKELVKEVDKNPVKKGTRKSRRKRPSQ